MSNGQIVIHSPYHRGSGCRFAARVRNKCQWFVDGGGGGLRTRADTRQPENAKCEKESTPSPPTPLLCSSAHACDCSAKMPPSNILCHLGESDEDARCEVPYLIRACPAQNSTDAMYFSRSSGTPEPPSSTIVLRIIVIGCIGSS